MHTWSGESSPHPFIARIPLACSLLLPLLIALLLFLLLGTAPSAGSRALPHPSCARNLWSPRMGRVGRVCGRWSVYKEDGYTEEGALLEGRLQEEVCRGRDG